MRVCFYQDTLGSNKKKKNIISAFSYGVREAGDVYEEFTDVHSYNPSDFVLILGAIPIHVTQKEEIKAFQNKTDMKKVSRNLLVKRQLENNKNTIVIESTLLGNGYYRVGLNHHLPNLGNFMSHGCSPDRWSFLKVQQDITMEKWRSSGDQILICLQREGGFAIRDINQLDWLEKTIHEIRNQTNRRIVIRCKHTPSHEWTQRLKKIVRAHKFVSMSETDDINIDAENAWACVVISSTVDIKMALKGIPVFTNYKRAFTYRLGNNDIRNIETPIMGSNRNKMFHELAYSQWSIDEMKRGLPWQRIKNIIKEIQ